MSFLLKELINGLLQIGRGKYIFIYSLSIHPLCLACCPESFNYVVYYQSVMAFNMTERSGRVVCRDSGRLLCRKPYITLQSLAEK